jgi:hypothetical protein
MNATFITSEIVSYLFKIGKSFASKAFEQDAQTEEVTNQYVNSWFQLYFGREEAYYLFREMECHVSQNIFA